MDRHDRLATRTPAPPGGPHGITDRSRLEQVQQTDLTEGRINEDFLFWLKKWGSTCLLVGMVILCIILGYVRWQQHRDTKADAAWQAFAAVENGLPSSLEEVADEQAGHTKAGAVSLLARLEAADAYLRAVQTGRDFVGAAGTPAPFPGSPPPETPLAADQRTKYLDRAYRLYEQVVTEAGEVPAMTIHAVSGLSGMAAIQESRGELDSARSLYERAAARAERAYPTLAGVSRARAQSTQRFKEASHLPAQDDLPKRDELGQSIAATQQRQPATIDDALRKMLLGDSGGPTMFPVP